MSEGTLILPCLCDHKDQDEMYGKGRRVHNRQDKKAKGDPEYACTVCGTKKKPKESSPKKL